MVARLLAVGLLIALGAVIGQQAFSGYIPVWSQGRYRFISIDELRDALNIQVPRAERLDYPILTTTVVDFEVAGEVLMVYRNGLLQREGVDYSLTASGIRFEPFPTQPGDLITVIREVTAAP